jgi:hypothetical protein
MKNLFLLLLVFVQFSVIAQMSVTTTSGTTNFTRHSGGSPGDCGANNYKYVGGATHSGSCVTMTPANTSDNSAALWACNSFNLDSSFKMTAAVTFGSNAALGDGIVFVLKKSELGNRMGFAGGYIGYHNTTASGTPIGMSLGVEFDTYNAASGTADENGDSGPTSNCNHAQIVRDGNLRTKVGGQTCLKSDGTSVNDGLSHALCIIWIPPSTLAAGGTFKAYIDGREVASAGDIRSYFDTKTVYWGFTAGDGAGTNLNNHIICNANMRIQDARKTALNPTCTVLLPVQLVDFQTKKYIENSTKISWKTQSERDNDYFTIEKSQDGIHFQFLANINGSGTTTLANYYEYVDTNPFSDLTYYRLTQTDYNGESQLLGLQVVENDDYEYTRVIKNPFDDYCKLTLKSNVNTSKQIAICDATGKVIYNETIQLSKGINIHEIDFTQHENGMYMIMVSDQNNTVWRKVIKLKN